MKEWINDDGEFLNSKNILFLFFSISLNDFFFLEMFFVILLGHKKNEIKNSVLSFHPAVAGRPYSPSLNNQCHHKVQFNVVPDYNALFHHFYTVDIDDFFPIVITFLQI